jgi:methylated-DNA-[protein]-cysteine S-methyltransferase/AraC family transcriptional regulator of adaptative response/methylated-DNA-[protein]-cysteine methyltransferase
MIARKMAAASASAHETTIRARMFLKARTGVMGTYIAPTFETATNYGVKKMYMIKTEALSRPITPVKKVDAVASHDIVFSIGDSNAGKILIARTVVGVCAVLIGADEDALRSDLEARFPDRVLTWTASKLNDELEKVAQYLDRPTDGFELPLDMRHGTLFQRRVWDALLTIPYGATITYAALARRIGDPNGARAVASACAANAIALGIPCHRVIRSNGTISGYRWSVELKRSLIDKEATA